MAKALFKAFPWADVYSDRPQRGNDSDRFKSVTVHGDPRLGRRLVINLYGQLFPGRPSPGPDSADARLGAFEQALMQIEAVPDLHSVGFPFGIGRGLAGGIWDKYYNLLEAFDARIAVKASVTLYKLP